MNYQIEFFNTSSDNIPIFRKTLRNMGNWRSRWQREKETHSVTKGLYIDDIQCVATDKDYIVKKVVGRTKKGNYFVATPMLEKKQIKRKTIQKNDLVFVKKSKKCSDCNNYISTYKKGFKPF